MIDPLQRQWLEVSAEALADAGYQKEDLWGRRIGVLPVQGQVRFIRNFNICKRRDYWRGAKFYYRTYGAHL